MIGFIVGFFVGTWTGVIIVALMMSAHSDDDELG